MMARVSDCSRLFFFHSGIFIAHAAIPFPVSSGIRDKKNQSGHYSGAQDNDVASE
jgi:hypothetical protein